MKLFEHNFDTSTVDSHQQFIHEFHWLGRRFVSRCQVDIFKKNDDTLVLFTDLGDGTSVTNASEQIATEIMKLKNLDPNKTLWAECYSEDFTNPKPPFNEKYPFDQITYEFIDGELRHPEWRNMEVKLFPALNQGQKQVQSGQH